jgi:N-acetylglucosaminyldiphosphoundecaprenol N-acetyl-beta-D-mannosaminyltransferase
MKPNPNLPVPKNVSIFGVCFDHLAKDELLDYIWQNACKHKKQVVANVNVHALNLAYEMPRFRSFLNNSGVVFCDGFGVLLGAALLGPPFEAKYRSTCPDWIEELAQTCQDHQLSLFLLAGKPGIAHQAAQKLIQAVPGLRVESHHGYFNQKDPRENAQVLSQINQFKPDILYVGMGMPVQEFWIEEHFAALDAQILLPLGACLDFYVGEVNRAPRWMTDHGLEWLGRLLIEPQRLWKRYILGNPLFIARVLLQKFNLVNFKPS